MKRLVKSAMAICSLLVLASCGAPQSHPSPPTEPVPGALSTQGYVYDDKLGYGFDYPGGWKFHVEEGDFPGNDVPERIRGDVIPYWGSYKKPYAPQVARIFLAIMSGRFTFPLLSWLVVLPLEPRYASLSRLPVCH